MRGTEQGRGGTARTGGRALTIALLALLLGASQAGLPLASAASIAADATAGDSTATLRSIPVPAGALAATQSVRVLSSWPARCLTPVSRTSGAGLLAAVLRGRVTIASPVGGTPVMLPVRLTADEASVGWSPDGRYLATGDGRLWTSKGKAAGRLFDSLTGFWGWSSVADCALGVTGGPTGFTPNRVLSVGMPGSHSTSHSLRTVDRSSWSANSGRRRRSPQASGASTCERAPSRSLPASRPRPVASTSPALPPAVDSCGSGVRPAGP